MLSCHTDVDLMRGGVTEGRLLTRTTTDERAWQYCNSAYGRLQRQIRRLPRTRSVHASELRKQSKARQSKARQSTPQHTMGMRTGPHGGRDGRRKRGCATDSRDSLIIKGARPPLGLRGIQVQIRVLYYGVIRVRVSARVTLRASSAPFPLPVWFGFGSEWRRRRFLLTICFIFTHSASTYWWQQHSFFSPLVVALTE